MIKICDDSNLITKVVSYLEKIKNSEKQRYGYDFWYAIYDESSHGKVEYPDTAKYELKEMARQAVRMRITTIIEENRTR